MAGWQMPELNGSFQRKIPDFYGSFSSTPCLMKQEGSATKPWTSPLPTVRFSPRFLGHMGTTIEHALSCHRQTWENSGKHMFGDLVLISPPNLHISVCLVDVGGTAPASGSGVPGRIFESKMQQCPFSCGVFFEDALVHPPEKCLTKA